MLYRVNTARRKSQQMMLHTILNDDDTSSTIFFPAVALYIHTISENRAMCHHSQLSIKTDDRNFLIRKPYHDTYNTYTTTTDYRFTKVTGALYISDLKKKRWYRQ